MAYVHVYDHNFFIVTDDQNKPTEKLTKSKWDWGGYIQANKDQIIKTLEGIGIKPKANTFVHKYTLAGSPAVYHVTETRSRTTAQPNLANRKKLIISSELKSLGSITGGKYSKEEPAEEKSEKVKPEKVKPEKVKSDKAKKMASRIISNFLKVE